MLTEDELTGAINTLTYYAFDAERAEANEKSFDEFLTKLVEDAMASRKYVKILEGIIGTRKEYRLFTIKGGPMHGRKLILFRLETGLWTVADTTNLHLCDDLTMRTNKRGMWPLRIANQMALAWYEKYLTDNPGEAPPLYQCEKCGEDLMISPFSRDKNAYSCDNPDCPMSMETVYRS